MSQDRDGGRTYKGAWRNDRSPICMVQIAQHLIGANLHFLELQIPTTDMERVVLPATDGQRILANGLY